MRSFKLLLLGLAASAEASCTKESTSSHLSSTSSHITSTTSSHGTSTTSSHVTSTTSSTHTSTSTTASTSSAPCFYETCVNPTAIPLADRPIVTFLCAALVTVKPVTATVTVSSTVTASITPSPVQVTSRSTTTTTTTTTTTVNTVCVGPTVTKPASTFVLYSSRGAAPSPTPVRRDGSMGISERTVPDFFASRCNGRAPIASKLSSACSCILTTPTSTVTLTVAATASVSLPAVSITTAVIVTATATTTVTAAVCTSTLTSTVTAPVACGTTIATATASTTGYISCPSSVASPSQNARHRIEGNNAEGTIFEDCIVAGPRNITTPSGGTHLCDGTQNNANPAPGTSITDQLDAAAQLNGFPYDGTYSNQFQDFFITSISATTQTSSQFWGLLNNGAFTPVGGCQALTVNGDRSLWAFDAFSVSGFLNIQPDYAVAQAGQGSVTIRVTSVDGNGGSGSNYGGASVAGQTSDSNGMVTIPIPTTPGCYQYKATASGQLRSNAFYLNVYEQFSTLNAP